ncbi:hypothetical protein ACHAPU_010422 [Fusarium lateritium]
MAEEIASELKKAASNSEDAFIAIMGPTGSGKSTFISKLVEDDVAIGQQLESCTTLIKTFRFKHPSGRRVLLVDTPSFDASNLSDRQVLVKISRYLSSAYKRGKKLNGIIYLQPSTDIRTSASRSKNVMMFKRMCGLKLYPRVALVTTRWEEFKDEQNGIRQENELMSRWEWWGSMYKYGSKVMPHKNNRESALKIVDTLLQIEGCQPLLIQRELVDEQMDLVKTAAGKEVNKELDEVNKKLDEATKRSEENSKAAQAHYEKLWWEQADEANRVLHNKELEYQEGARQAQQEETVLQANIAQLLKDHDEKALDHLTQLNEADRKSRRQQDRHRQQLQQEKQSHEDALKIERAEHTRRDKDRESQVKAETKDRDDQWRAHISSKKADLRRVEEKLNESLRIRQRDAANFEAQLNSQAKQKQELEDALQQSRASARKSQAQFDVLSVQHQGLSLQTATPQRQPTNNYYYNHYTVNKEGGYHDGESSRAHKAGTGWNPPTASHYYSNNNYNLISNDNGAAATVPFQAHATTKRDPPIEIYDDDNDKKDGVSNDEPAYVPPTTEAIAWRDPSIQGDCDNMDDNDKDKAAPVSYHTIY